MSKNIDTNTAFLTKKFSEASESHHVGAVIGASINTIFGALQCCGKEARDSMVMSLRRVCDDLEKLK